MLWFLVPYPSDLGLCITMRRTHGSPTMMCLLALVAASLLACSQAIPLERESHLHFLGQAQQNPAVHFAQWAAHHGKSYLDDAQEFAKRMATWAENLEFVLAYNARGGSAWLGLNALADLTQEEYRTRYLGFDNAARKARPQAQRRLGASFRYANVDAEALPAAIDWREHSAVSEVKNQAQCGSCWAFSTTGAIEGINGIVTGKLQSLSEQELVDCDTLEDKGCSGGLMDNAFQFVIDNGGLDTEADYPYTAMDGQCLQNKLKRHVVVIDGYEDVPENDETSLKKAVAHQPVSVAIEADQKSFQLYMGGVFADETCGTELDHGVLVVGYGKDPTEGMYWIVKNSWGAEWGDQGYIRMKANIADSQGLCGIAMVASYPTKKGPNPPEPSPEPDPSPTPGPAPGPGPAPPPGPVKCDDSAACPPDTTCCCITDIFNICLQWGCCPMPKAVCCDDHQHCCPHDAPVCDTASGRCSNKAGTYTTPLYEKIPAEVQPSIFDRLFKRQHQDKQKPVAQV